MTEWLTMSHLVPPFLTQYSEENFQIGPNKVTKLLHYDKCQPNMPQITLVTMLNITYPLFFQIL